MKPIDPKPKAAKGFTPYLPRIKKTPLKIAKNMVKPVTMKPLTKG